MPFFIIRLHDDDNPVDETGDRTFYPHLHGPYETDQLARGAMPSVAPYDKEARFLMLEGSICKLDSSPLEKPESQKRAPGNEANWRKVGEDEVSVHWICRECQAPIQAVRVAHPIHSRSMPGAGSGQCQYEAVGYCPNCEKKPSFHGDPIIGED